VGAGCCLRALPSEVLMLILEAAAPARPCEVVVETRHWIPGEEGSSDSDSSGGGEEEEDSSDSSSEDR
jgi:hypothetical protein